MNNFFSKNRLVLLYGASFAAILFLLKWLELRFVIIDHSFEVYVSAIALIFTCLGIWLALKLSKPSIKTVVVEKQVFMPAPAAGNMPDEQLLRQYSISKREWEVLQLMCDGCSNQEIADRLFISLNTVKTHAARLFEKLEVKRRTQAIEKAKRLGLLA